MKWSYKTIHFELKKEGLLGSSFLDETEIEQELNEFGAVGWELLSVLEVKDGIIAFFKQPLSIRGSFRHRQELIESEEPEYEEFDEQEQEQEDLVLVPAAAARLGAARAAEPEPEPEPETTRRPVQEEDHSIGTIRIE